MSTRRCSAIAPVGSLLKGQPKKKQPSPAGRNPREHNPGHLVNIRLCPCVICGKDPAGVAAHVRMTAPGKPNPGVGAKPHDRYTVPLCAKDHTTQHSMGEAKFWKQMGLDAVALAGALFKAGNLDAMKKVARMAYAGRRT